MSKTIKKKKSTRKQSKIASLMVVVAIMIVCAVAVVKMAELKTRSRELTEAEKQLELKIEQANVEKENLIAREQYMHTKQYIEDQAKEKFGLVYPDEIVIKPSE